MRIITLSVLIVSVMIGSALIFINSNNSNTQLSNDSTNLSMIDGNQIITINAKGGYSPKITNAKANVPTILKVTTSGTFDCSSAISIPSLSYRKNLEPTGVAEIMLPPQKANSTLKGLCSMGMYNFTINFN